MAVAPRGNERGEIFDDCLISALKSWRVVAVKDSALTTPNDREFYQYVIEGDDEQGRRQLVIFAEDLGDAAAYLRDARAGLAACQHCGQPIAETDLAVWEAGSNLEWAYHLACCDDKREE